jgi:hypothetical protein
VCEEERYLLELVRYIHLNPYRAGLVKDMAGLAGYEWSGHATLMGRRVRPWQETREILGRFGNNEKTGRRGYEKFVGEGSPQGRRPELTGGGLVRSAGGWSEVMAMRRQKRPEAADARVLGGGRFVETVLQEAENRERETLRFKRMKGGFEKVCREVARRRGLRGDELTSGGMRSALMQAREDVAQIAVRKLGMSGAEVARRLGVTASCINRIVATKEPSSEARKMADELPK